MNPRQAILWGRFSSDRQGDGDSKDRQERENRALARQRGIKIVAEYFDEGVSVKDGATPLFRKVVSELPKGVGIICENLDRISRGHPWRTKAFIADILEANHFIITSQDGREYTEASIDELDTLVITIERSTTDVINHFGQDKLTIRNHLKALETAGKAKNIPKKGLLKFWQKV